MEKCETKFSSHHPPKLTQWILDLNVRTIKLLEDAERTYTKSINGKRKKWLIEYQQK